MAISEIRLQPVVKVSKLWYGSQPYTLSWFSAPLYRHEPSEWKAIAL